MKRPKQLPFEPGPVFDAMPTGMAVFDREGRYLWLNRKLASFNGLPVEAHLGRTVVEVIGEWAASQMATILRVAERAEPETVEATAEDDTGTERIWTIDFTPVLDDDGEAYAVSAIVHDVTPRHRADEALARQTRRLEIAIDASGAGIFDRPEPLDGTGYYSERFLELIGLGKLAEAVASGDASALPSVDEAASWFYEQVHPDDLEKVRVGREALASGELSTLTNEFRVRRPEGGYRHLRSFSERVEPSRPGEPVRTMGFVLDITEQHEMEAALRESESRYRRMVQQSPVPKIVYAEDGEVVIVNDAWTRLTGYTHEDLPTTQRWLELAYGHDPARFEQMKTYVRQVYDNEETRTGEVELRVASGELRTMEFTNGPVGPLPDGRRLRCTVLVDVTEQRALEEALRQSEARYRRIVELSPVAMAIYDSRGDFLILNDEWVRLTGYARDELRTLDDWFRLAYGHDPKIRRKLESIVQKVLHDDRTRTGEVCIQRGDGELREVGFTSGSLGVLPDGRHLRSSVLIDITRHRQIERELREAKTAAEDASRAKSEFLAHISHEIRTPMSVILGYTDILREALREPWHREPLRAIQRNGEHLVEVIDDILDLSRIEAGRLVLEPRPIEVIRLMRDLLALMGGRAEESGVELSVAIEGLVPEHITTDPTRLRQILVNLIGNAIKFTGAGGRVDVGLSWDDALEQVAFEVRDTGCGVRDEEREHIFEPFARSSTSGEVEGVGLGLTITRRLVRMLGGTIELRDRQGPEEGSIFRFTTDPGDVEGAVWLDPSEPLTLRPRVETPTEPLPSLEGRILLADDEATLREMVARRLRQAGATVVEAGDGEQALARFEAEGPFDAVLLDMKMPVRNGYDTARALRQRGYEGRIVAVTAHAMKGVREDCLAAGCDAYITKPIDFAALFTVLTTGEFPAREVSEAVEIRRTTTGVSTADDLPLVLVVDDDPDAGRMLAMFLRRRGLAVTVVSDGRSALNSPDAPRADVVVTDVQLPDMRGHDVARGLRKLNPHCRIIGYSGHPPDADATDAFDQYLMKPVEPKILLRAVEGAVQED